MPRTRGVLECIAEGLMPEAWSLNPWGLWPGPVPGACGCTSPVLRDPQSPPSRPGEADCKNQNQIFALRFPTLFLGMCLGIFWCRLGSIWEPFGLSFGSVFGSKFEAMFEHRFVSLWGASCPKVGPKWEHVRSRKLKKTRKC